MLRCCVRPAWRLRCPASPRWGWKSSGSATSRLLLGGYRAVFSLLLTVILIGIGAGSLRRRLPASPHRATGAMVDGGAGTVRRVLACGTGRREQGTIKARRWPIPRIRQRWAACRGGARRGIWTGANARGTVVQLRDRSCWRWSTGAADGPRVSAGQRDHPARRTPRRPSRRRPLSVQHRRRGVRLAGRRLPASARAWDSGQRRHPYRSPRRWP